MVVALLLPVPRAAAQGTGRGGDDRRVHAYTLLHQPASEALQLVHPLLSAEGTVELQPGANTLVVRDRAEVIERVVALLAEFDHPASPVELEIRIVKAGVEAAPGDASELPPALVARLRELLRYESYRLLARARLEVREGEEVTHQLGEEYRVGFRMGTLREDRRLKLHGFRVARDRGNPEPEQLIHTNLNLWLDKPMILGLARAESSREALMLVLTCSLGSEAEP